MMGVSRLMRTLAIVLMGATIVMAQTAAGAPAAASDPQIDPRVRTLLAEHSSPFFWELLPGSQVRAISTDPQAKTPVDLELKGDRNDLRSMERASRRHGGNG